MALLISVSPAGEGWAIHSDALAADLVFPSGGQAENAARALAHRKAEEGRAAEVRIYLRGGALAGVLSYPSPLGRASDRFAHQAD